MTHPNPDIAQRAAQILMEPTFQGVLDTIRNETFGRWINTEPADTVGRELMYAEMRALEHVLYTLAGFTAPPVVEDDVDDEDKQD